MPQSLATGNLPVKLELVAEITLFCIEIVTLALFFNAYQLVVAVDPVCGSMLNGFGIPGWLPWS